MAQLLTFHQHLLSSIAAASPAAQPGIQKVRRAFHPVTAGSFEALGPLVEPRHLPCWVLMRSSTLRSRTRSQAPGAKPPLSLEACMAMSRHSHPSASSFAAVGRASELITSTCLETMPGQGSTTRMEAFTPLVLSLQPGSGGKAFSAPGRPCRNHRRTDGSCSWSAVDRCFCFWSRLVGPGGQSVERKAFFLIYFF